MTVQEVLQLNNMDLLVLLAVILIFVFIILSEMKSQGNRMKMISPEIRVQVVCRNCGFKVIRNFREGDYISKIVDEKCEKCGGEMIVDLIYAIQPKEKTK